jgi:DNA-binding NarL/FixJ family response regulator
VRITASERAILRDWATGMTAGAIARERGTSRRTVQNQLRAIYRKLNVSSRAELIGRMSR